MEKLTPTEQKFVKKCREFMSRHDLNFSQIGNNPKVHYSNLVKLEEFIIQEKGTISMSVQGRIELFMKNYKPKKK